MAKSDKTITKKLEGKRTWRDVLTVIWRFTFARIGEDWVFLALLGVCMALLSFVMDYGIAMCQRARLWLYKDLATHPALQFCAWVTFPVVLILFSSGFTHIVAPQAIGSGIPELKTILRGVVLKEYLTFRTFLSKVIGLTSSLGSGMPLGKEGPFVHISSMMAALLSKLFTSFRGVWENESKSHEMLAAACAVGVASCFGAPVGGVLFSIEATSAYFAVRNYWRGFFAAVCGALMFRLLSVWYEDKETITALFMVDFNVDVPFDPQELIAFALLGVLCGFGGSSFVWLHRKYVLWMRNNKRLSAFLQKNRFIYPTVITTCIAAFTFPLGLGQYFGAELSNHDQVTNLFSNFTWSSPNLEPDEELIVNRWDIPPSNMYFNLAAYTAVVYFTCLLACTLPVASGIFIPHLKMGAGFGRLFGELLALWLPARTRLGRTLNIVPGGYAVAGAAAWAGAVTHTVSTSLIVFELTGQISFFLPVMIAVLAANAVAQSLQPSMYDSIIKIKKLPYLPDIVTVSSEAYNIYVEDMMVRDIKYIWLGCSYRDIRSILNASKKIQSFPLVDSPDSMILLGSVQRTELIGLLIRHLGKERRLQIVAIRARQKLQQQMEAKTKESSPASGSEGSTASTATASPSLMPDPESLQQRRPSRFEVTPAPDVLEQKPAVDESVAIEIHDQNESSPVRPSSLPAVPTIPKKSILKKANSFGLSTQSPDSPPGTPYSTVTSQDSRIKLALNSIIGRSKGQESQDEHKREDDQMTVTSHTGSKKVQLPKERIIDMSPEEQAVWEEEELDSIVNFDKCHIDPAPFQLVERTSLLKVHSLFSLLGLNHAYVTAIGRLVGVVALKELLWC